MGNDQNIPYTTSDTSAEEFESGYENKQLDSSIDEQINAVQSFAMEFGNFSLDKIWIPPVENTKLLYYKTKVAGSLTDTSFIGSDQHLLAHCMFSIDGAKQEKQLRNVETKGQHVSNIDPLDQHLRAHCMFSIDGAKQEKLENSYS